MDVLVRVNFPWPILALPNTKLSSLPVQGQNVNFILGVLLQNFYCFISIIEPLKSLSQINLDEEFILTFVILEMVHKDLKGHHRKLNVHLYVPRGIYNIYFREINLEIH